MANKDFPMIWLILNNFIHRIYGSIKTFKTKN